MKVRVDPVMCEGFGTCNAMFPELFLLDEWGYAYTEADGEVPHGKEKLALESVAACPVHAISVVEEI
jgi:ferredoxin